MTWVKICGITNLEDAKVAVEAGADALGFVFYEKSPRNVTPEVAREIVASLPAQVEKVGVFVDGSELSLVSVVCQVELTAIQNIASFPPSAPKGPQIGIDFASLGRRPKMYVSFPITYFLDDAEKISGLAKDFQHLRRDVPEQLSSLAGLFDTFFLDSGTLQQPGGTGKVFDWERVVPIAKGMQDGGLKLVVAGGLTPSNVADAMRILKPWGVDVSSGVEARPGKKDPGKVRAFIQAVRDADERSAE